MARTNKTNTTTTVGEDRRMPAPSSGVTVRMYRPGLGDCFLLAFPKGSKQGREAPPKPFYVLIDCGVFKGTPGGSDKIGKIAEDIRLATNDQADGKGTSRIDLLVVTHEHWDHLSGFHENQTQAIFEKIVVGAVWLPWTENPVDDMARRLRGMKAKVAKGLALAYKALVARNTHGADAGERVRGALNMLGFGDEDGAIFAAAPRGGFDRVDGSGQALKWIKDRYKDVITFREPGPDPKHNPLLPGLDNVRIYVLGPPKDEDLIRRLRPREREDEAYSKSKGIAAAVESSYFAAFGMMPGEVDPDEPTEDVPRVIDEHQRRSRPFDEAYRVEADDAKQRADDYRLKLAQAGAGGEDTPAARFHAGRFYARTYHDPIQQWRTIDDEWLAAAGQFALNVDGLANNSSLTLAIELSPGGRVLLFPGDAQTGNWLSWFGEVDYPNGEKRGKEMEWTLEDGSKVDAKDLLARTVLYKVGHHGSHNATLKRRGLELMGTRWPDEFVAMLPVNENLARNHTTYGEMPLTSIVGALLERTKGKLIRADDGDKPDPHPKHPKFKSTLDGVDGRKPLTADKWPERRDDPKELYFDYTVKDEEPRPPARRRSRPAKP